MTTLQELRQSYTDDSGLSMEAKYNSWFERISSFRDSVTYPAAPLNIGGVQASYNDFLNEGNKLNFDARAILSSINAFVLERNFSCSC